MKHNCYIEKIEKVHITYKETLFTLFIVSRRRLKKLKNYCLQVDVND